ncbi:MAG: DNA-processing protein DprA [Coriobacteriales bacterium]
MTDVQRFELRVGEEGYPRQLAVIPDPPLSLYGLGDPSILEEGLAVVGARQATPYGLECTRLFAGRAAALGVVVVSGAAIGCDQAAARAALEQGGKTVAVMGCGADVVYPRSASSLLADIVSSGGAVVSEQRWGVQPRKGMFVRRNRIIAGLARATLIVEAGLPSGTFGTADAALSAGRDVLVVPGSIHSPESRGSNRLLYQGAHPVVDIETFDAALSMLFPVLVPSGSETSGIDTSGLSPEQARLVHALAAAPMRAGEAAEKLGIESRRAMVLLSECEAFGFIERYRDGRYGAPLA